ncbi:GerAB/ArcD/ProY family transporter [Fredinandcohnia sp. 179-A 10B2 NHS]|uniref:GerAB/ArcD/ProY family transporter n=1 Tax=Fredinandcohnia sp. 179-A 10B2 NHS TaxID=3235176 RepID=UPI0039A32E82
MRVQITNGMFMAIIINLVYAKAIGLTQGSMAREIGSDMWIATALSTFQGALFMLLTVLIIRRLPQSDLIEQSAVLGGKWFSKVISLLLFVFFIGAFGAVMTTFVYHLKDYFLPDAPILLFIIVPFLIGVYGIMFGLEVIGRMAVIGILSILALNILLLLGSLSNFDIRELLPVFRSGVGETLWASRHNNTDWAMATMMAALILPNVKNPKTWGKSGVAGIGYGGAFVLMWPILEAGVLSAEVTGNYIISCMQMARSAEIGLFIHRYEMIMIAFFALSSITQILMTLLCASISFQRLFNLKDYRPVIIPVGIILCAYSYWLVFDHHRAIMIMENQWVLVASVISIFVPGFVWTLGIIRKKKLLHKRFEEGL